MKHPTREEWISYLYGDISPEQKLDLESHLETCPSCARELGDWRQTMGDLDAWQLPITRRTGATRLNGPPWMKWAAAAVVALGLGFGIGRASAPAPDLTALRTGIEQQLRAEFRAEMQTALAGIRTEIAAAPVPQPNSATPSADALQPALAELKRLFDAHESKHLEERQAILAALQTLNLRVARQAADLETVAVLTEASLRNAQQQLVQLTQTTHSNPEP